jgi:hypothetical protein
VSDWRDWKQYRAHLRIEDRSSGQLVSLQPNAFQRRIREAIVAADREGRPARLIILKSRRMGSSTLVQATLAHRMFTRPRYSTVTIAHDDDSSGYLHEMASTMWDELPEVLRQRAQGKMVGVRGKRLSLGNGSTSRTQTAANTTAGRGKGARAIHASEVAFWDDAKKTLLAVRSMVPDEPGTLVVLESTANGVGDEFHREWMRARSGASGYVALFAAWFEDERNQLPVPPDGLGDLDEEESLLVERGVTPEQISWRRWAIENRCGGDIDQFHQEYPSSDTEAFITSGRTYWKERDLAQVDVDQEPRRGRVEGDPIRGGGSLRFVAHRQGPLSLYGLPQRDGRRYVVFVDPADTLTLDDAEALNDRRLTRDPCCMQVVDCSTGLQVAEWHGDLDGDLLAYEAARVGYLFGTAEVAVEATGGYGAIVLSKLWNELGYPNVYVEEEHSKVDHKVTRRLGWHTTTLTRPEMLDALTAVLRERPHLLRSAELLGEMRTFVLNRRGKPVAASGCHDDRVMAMAGAYALYLRRVQAPVRLEKRKRPKGVQSSVIAAAPRV